MSKPSWFARLQDWQPNYIFYRSEFDKYIKYDEPDVSFFGTTHGFWTHKAIYTPLGKWFRGKPLVLYALVGLVWYPPAWLVWWLLHVLVFPWVGLFTDKWDAS